MSAQFNPAELRAKVDSYIKDLAQLTDAARQSETMLAFIESCTQFHQYSFNNQLLIKFFSPYATRVAGYKTWVKHNRYVKKGEKGIPILAPCISREVKDDESSPMVLKGFKVTYVFDVSQTDGEPLPPMPDWKSKAVNGELENTLLSYAKAKNIIVTREAQLDDTQGYSQGGKIVLAPDAGTKTLVHELAHELLHYGDQAPSKATKEIEAEAVAYVVCAHFDLPGLNSPNYLALFDADASKLAARTERIRKAACEIISYVEMVYMEVQHVD